MTDERLRYVGKARGEWEVQEKLQSRIEFYQSEVDRLAQETGYVAELERKKAQAFLEFFSGLWIARYGELPLAS